MTGRTSAIAAITLTFTEVVNGSVTPRVTRFLSSGRGAMSQRRSFSWNANVKMEGRHDREQADDQPGAKLVQVLDERCLLTVSEAARKPPTPLGHRALARRRVPARSPRRECREALRACRAPTKLREALLRAGTSSPCRRRPETESLNSRIPFPSDRPISGRRLAPKTSSRTSKIRTSSHQAKGIDPRYHPRPRARPPPRRAFAVTDHGLSNVASRVPCNRRGG